jgi:integrase
MTVAKGKSDAGGRLTDAVVRALPVPASGNKITYERGPGAVRGFGARVTANHARSFILGYTIDGRERRLTIGSYPTWGVAAARDRAKELRRDIDRGIDPLGQREAARTAPTVSELSARYLSEHAVPKKRTAAYDAAMIRRFVVPELGFRKVASIAFADVDRLHRKVTEKNGGPAANRVLALLSKMFNLSIRWEMRADNPCKGIERNREEPRHRYLSGDETRRLTAALAAHPQQTTANAIRLLVLSGARRGEVLNARWDEFDLEAGVWTKPSAHVKTKVPHRVPLSAPTRQLLVGMKAEALREEGRRAGEASPYLFPGRSTRGALTELTKSWAAICKAADLKNVRVHDLRHSFASILVSSGASLPLIGALLGHTQPGTTARYAHLYDDPLRAATERVGAVVTGSGKEEASTAEVVKLGTGRRR